MAAVGATEAEAAISRWSLRRRKRGAEGDADSGHGRADALIVALGNPGDQYAGTRHNLGFEVATELSRRWDMPKPRKRYGGLIAEGRTGMGGPRVAILMPQTYMNDSGKAAGPARGELGVPIDRVIAVHDEIDLPFGEVRSKLGGGVAGHNGLKSLAQGLGERTSGGCGVESGGPTALTPRSSPATSSLASASPARTSSGWFTRRRRNRAAGGADRRTRRRTQGGPGLMPLTSYAVNEKQVALIRLEREKARNAINTAMLKELLVHLTGRRRTRRLGSW